MAFTVTVAGTREVVYVVIVNVADRAPAATWTNGGADATEFWSEDVGRLPSTTLISCPFNQVCTSTSVPPVGATSVNVTVPVTEPLATTEEALSVKALRVTATGCTVTFDERVTPLGSVADTTAEVVTGTGFVSSMVCPDDPETANVLVNATPSFAVPQQHATEASVDVTDNCQPLFGVSPLRVATPVNGTVPPMRLVGLIVNADSDGGSTVTAA
jgi:hypothetical protein